MPWCGPPSGSKVLSTGDWLDVMPGFWRSMGCGANFNHLHAVQLKGPRLDMKRLRLALDRLQAQHPRLRARLIWDASGQHYLVEDNTPLPIHEKEGADPATMNLDLEAALLTHMDEHPSVFVTYIWYGDAAQRALLLVGMRHGPGDGRAVEIALAQLLLLYEGRPLPEGTGSSHMNYTEIISFDGSLSKEQVQRWRSIEAEYPPKIRNAQHDTFVQPRHPEFRAVFEGFCLELMRLDASETKALAKASRASGTTVTGAIVAAAHLAVLKELQARCLEADRIKVGLLMNERSFVDKRYSQEMGNFASALHWFSEVQPDFWHTAREARRFMDRVIQEKCTFPGFIIQNEFLSMEMLQMLSSASAELVAGFGEQGDHVSVSSLGVLTSFGKYDSFEVLENIQAALAGFMTGINLSVCTSGASGTMTMSVQVTKNIVPRARELAKAVSQHIKEALSNPPPVEPGVDAALSPVGADFRQACEIMEPLIAKNKQRLVEAHRTAHGASAMMGDVSGAYTWKTHFLVPVVTLFAILSSGPLQAFPLYVRQLMDAGVFSWACEDGARSCSEQGESLQDLYTSTFSAQMRFFILVGLAYDMYGARVASCLGALTAALCFVGLAVAASLDSQAWPLTQSTVMYFCFLFADLGGNLASFSVLGWMWHYPLLQTFFIGLSNAATQASGSLGFVFNSLAEKGVNIVESFLVLAGLSLLSGLVFLLSCPTKLQTLTQAGRVLNTHPSSLDVYSIVGWKAIKHSVKEACGVYNLYPRQNTCMLLYIGFFMAGELTCFSGLEARYRALFHPAEADSLLAAYATLMAVLGIAVNPAAGLLFDCFGFLNVFAFTSFLAFLVPFTLMVPILWVQLLNLFFLVTWFSLFLNVVSRYSVTFAPPDFFGTFTGFLTSLAGIIAYFVDAVLQLPRPTGDSLIATASCSMLIGWAFSVYLAVLMHREDGLPRKPPKNHFG